MVYDRDGKELLYQFEEERREVIKYSDIPHVLVNATIASEDHTFFSNPGVDLLGIVRAAFADLTHRDTGAGGASTITQQLVKVRLVGSENTLTRKIREAIVSIEVTRTYSKEQILELYFNQIYYGNQAYGIKAAAESYFGKSDLSIRRRPRTRSGRPIAVRTSSIRCRASGRSPRPRRTPRTRRRSRRSG